jgi:hypothetical protein
MIDDLDLEEIAGHKGLGPAAKIQYILQYARRKQSQMFYETGVWYGETINGLKGHFDRLVSIEISAQIADLARQRFAKDPNVEILTGDSVKLLPGVLASRDRAVPAIFWLDGHFSGSRFETAKADMDTPILTELDITLAQVEDHDVVLIDDARLFQGYDKCAGDFGTECYPTINDLRSVLCRRQPSWSFHVEDDLVRMEKESVGGGAAVEHTSSRSTRGRVAPTSPASGVDGGRVGSGRVGGKGGPGTDGVAGFGPKTTGARGKIPSGRGVQSAAEGPVVGGKSPSQSGRKVPSFGSSASGATSRAPPSPPPAQVDTGGAFHIKL